MCCVYVFVIAMDALKFWNFLLIYIYTFPLVQCWEWAFQKNGFLLNMNSFHDWNYRNIDGLHCVVGSTLMRINYFIEFTHKTHFFLFLFSFSLLKDRLTQNFLFYIFYSFSIHYNHFITRNVINDNDINNVNFCWSLK